MSPLPRVLILSLHFPPEPTGNAPYVGSLARGLNSRGFKVEAITGQPHYPEWRFKSGFQQRTRKEKYGSIKLTRLRHHLPTAQTSAQRLISELSFGARILVARWGRPSVVVLVSPALFATAVAVLRARLHPAQPKVVIWVQDLYSLGVKESIESSRLTASLMASVESLVLRKAHGVAVIHNRFAKHAVETLGVDADRIEVIRNWTHIGTQMSATANMRSVHDWSDDETVILHAGNMGAKQGLQNVIDAARIAAERKLPLRFVLLGDGNQRRALEKYGEGVGNLQFLDPVEDGHFRATLASADILLVNEKPGVSEMSVPSKLTSYFGSGRPVIAATDPSGVTASEIAAAEAGLVVSAGRPLDLVEACLTLRDSPETARKYADNGAHYRDQVLDENAAIDNYSRWLSSLMQISPKRNRA